MLETLRIKNIAIIDLAEIHFGPGLNIISGETGAGKSIVIEAISLLLGSRAQIDLIRSGCDEAVIEGVFRINEMPWLHQRLEQYGFATCDGDLPMEMVVKRTVHRSGRHRISINGELANLSTLQKLCEGLVDLCGQSEHQSLTKPALQLELLDQYGGLTSEVKGFASEFQEYKRHVKEKQELEVQEGERAKRVEFIRFQINEIERAQIQPLEDVQLNEEKQLLQSAEQRGVSAQMIRDALGAEDGGLVFALSHAMQKGRLLAGMDPRAQVFLASMERAAGELEDVLLGLDRYLGQIELDPERYAQVQDRTTLIADLKRKYGRTLDEVFGNFERLKSELIELQERNQRIEEISNRLLELRERLETLGESVSKRRNQIAKLFSESVTAELQELKMGEAQLDVSLEAKAKLDDWNFQGKDAIQFLVRTNRGEDARPLGKIASGGELSRILLAIRRVIANRGGIGVYLFDEIDAGIGGQTAFQVGKKLKSVSRFNQVLCITHLPQVASFADHHIVVRKAVTAKRTRTVLRCLDLNERKDELARMLGGPELTQKSLENASELLEVAARISQL